MGEILEMTLPRAFLLSLLLIGCSSTQSKDPYFALITNFAQSVKAQTTKVPPPPLPEQVLTRDQVMAAEAPVLYAIIPSNGAYAALSQLGENDGYVTWATPDNVTLTLKAGLVTASRGLGDDLTSADVAGLEAGLAGKSGAEYTRSYRFFTAEFGTRTETATCTLSHDGPEPFVILGKSHATSRYTERCISGTTQRENRYWKASRTGNLIYSEQWVSPEMAHIRLWLLSE